MAFLPYELLAQIATHVPRTHLPSLALTSRTCQSATEPLLYRTLSSADSTPARLCRALLQLSKRRRGSHVHALTLELHTWTPAQRRLLRAFLVLLARALAQTPNLDTLVLLGFSEVPEAGRLLRDCRAQPRTFVSDIAATEWLGRQVRLETLVLAIKRPMESFEVSPSAMPRLRTVCAHSSVLRALVPGRPVEHIAHDITLEHESRNKAGDEAVMRALTQSTVPLRTLGIQYRPSADGEDYVVWPECPPFDDGASVMMNVEHLEFYVPTFHYFEVRTRTALSVKKLIFCPGLRERRPAVGPLPCVAVPRGRGRASIRHLFSRGHAQGGGCVACAVCYPSKRDVPRPRRRSQARREGED